ncbi:10066_t:CDS:2 [Ambispora gerdemannii]|uniref:10066_t:CDS:1 n=1 Tax=Ambispora gerdemannii TaxID=144530 RepID=A0A9N8Z5X2_9GLOM|nr:10066_t:CDS:2 [Ambispora gerdemannii]
MSLLNRLNSHKIKINRTNAAQAKINETSARNDMDLGSAHSGEEGEAIAFPTVKKDRILEQSASEKIYHNIVACVRKGTMHEKDMLNLLIDSDITSTVEHFSRIFMTYVNEKEQEACRIWMEMSGVDEFDLISKNKRLCEEIDQDEEEEIEEIDHDEEEEIEEINHDEEEETEEVDQDEEEEIEEIDQDEEEEIDQDEEKKIGQDEEEEIDRDKHLKESFYVNASLKKVNGLNGINCIKKSAQDENGPKIEVSLYFIEKILNRCFGRLPKGEPNLQFYPIKVVQYLIKNDLLPNSRIENGLMKALIERCDWESIALLLQFGRDIPEKDQVFLLQHLITLSKTSKVDEGFKKFTGINDGASSNSPRSSPMLQYFLPKLMLAKRQNNLMQLHMKQLKVDELLILFEISCTWLDEYINGSKGDSSRTIQLQNSVPSFSTIIEFVTLLVDAHFLTLILTNDLHSSLQRLSNYTNTSVQRCEEIRSAHRSARIFYEKNQAIERQRKEREQNQNPISKKQRLNNNRINKAGAVTIFDDQYVPKYSIEMLRVFDDAWWMDDSDEEC